MLNIRYVKRKYNVYVAVLDLSISIFVTHKKTDPDKNVTYSYVRDYVW